MISRFKFVSAFVLGLALVSGAVTDASARLSAPHRTQSVHTTSTAKPVGTMAAAKTGIGKSTTGKMQRLHVARARHAHKGHLAHRLGTPRVVGNKAAGATKTARTHARQHLAMAHRTGGKTSVVR